MRDKITIIIADEQRIFRGGLKSLLSEKDNINIVAEADDGDQALEMSLNHKPRIVFMDIGMPKTDGIEATRQIRERLPKNRGHHPLHARQEGLYRRGLTGRGKGLRAQGLG